MDTTLCDEFGVATQGEQLGAIVQAKSKVGSVRRRQPRKPKKTERQKFIDSLLKKAGLTELPPLEQLTAGMTGEMTTISDVAVFITEPRAEMLRGISSQFPNANTINLSSRVSLRQIKTVGVDILMAGKMFMPCMVAEIEETGTLECWSGRHRLAFLALVYGPNVEVPIVKRRLLVSEARDAVVFANKARRTGALEKAEHRVLKAVGGDIELDRDTIYTRAIVRKTDVPHFCAYSVVDAKMHGGKLDFVVSKTGSRKDGITTVGNLIDFWKRAIRWDSTMGRVEFDGQLKESVNFLNRLVVRMQSLTDFNCKHHLAAKVMAAIGHYYRSIETAGDSVLDSVDAIADAIVSMGAIGSHKADETLNELVRILR